MLYFMKRFIKSPQFIGAIAPSGKDLSKKMIEDINFKNCNYIIEYGAGTGSFTKEIIKRKKDSTKFIIFETDKEFYKNLKKSYQYKKNVTIINDSAENVKDYLDKLNIKKVDYIVSGLPFTSLPVYTSKIILKKSSEILSENGYFFTFQYSLVKKKFFNEYFFITNIKRSFLNLPPAYILIFQIKSSKIKSNKIDCLVKSKNI